MRTHVFAPLGMQQTDYVLSERVRAQLAQGYQFGRGEFSPVEYQTILTPGAGSVFSTLNDMALYMRALLRGGRNEHGTLLEPGTLRLMLQPHYQRDTHLPAMGLGFILEDIAGHQIVWHNGGWYGFSSEMFLAPDDDLGIILFTNTLSFALHDAARGLLRRLLDLPAPAAQLPRPGLLETAHLWPELTGSYGPASGLSTNLEVWSSSGGEVEVVVKGNRLALRSLLGKSRAGDTLYRADPTRPLVFEARHDQDVQAVVFFRDAAGKIAGLYLGLHTFYKRPRTRSLRFRLAAGLGAFAGAAAALAARRLWKWGHAQGTRHER